MSTPTPTLRRAEVIKKSVREENAGIPSRRSKVSLTSSSSTNGRSQDTNSDIQVYIDTWMNEVDIADDIRGKERDPSLLNEVMVDSTGSSSGGRGHCEHAQE